jgi:protein disulfide-isomerase A6
LDEIAEKFVAASKSARAEIVKEAKLLAEKINKTSASHYLKIMEKLASGAGSYVEKERKR